MEIQKIEVLPEIFKGDSGLWKKAEITYKKKTYTVTFKSYKEGSQFGINGGRISKLTITRNKEEVCNYDRGWDKKPADKETTAVLEAVLDNEN